MFRLATKAGVISTCMNASALELVQSGITLQSMGLDGILDNNMALIKDGMGNWKNRMPIRSHACAASKTGGQGMVRCGCTGRCLTLSCSCKKANRECNSRFYKHNTKCENLQCRD